VPVAFRFFNVTPIAQGDFDANGTLDAADIELLTADMLSNRPVSISMETMIPISPIARSG
jgi:hypothetical protein